MCQEKPQFRNGVRMQKAKGANCGLHPLIHTSTSSVRTLDQNDTVGDLAALSGCTSVTGSLSINYSPLTSLEGLECLTHVGGLLDIYKNPSLKSLAALDSITSVGGDLRIRRNYELCTSLADALRDQVLDAGGIGGSINISDNKSGC